MIIKSYTQTRRKALVSRLELYYSHKLYQYSYWKENNAIYMNRTAVSKIDRRFRIELKSIEILLENLDSQLFKNEQKSSIRQTKQIKAKRAFPRKS